MPRSRALVRSTDPWLAGVLGGVADYFGWNSDTLRVLYAIATLFTGVVPLVTLYIVLFLLMPSPTLRASTTREGEDG